LSNHVVKLQLSVEKLQLFVFITLLTNDTAKCLNYAIITVGTRYVFLVSVGHV